MTSFFDPMNFLGGVEAGATDLFEQLTELVAGKADSLRNGTEFDPVVLPRDLAAHSNVQTEWWYYTGHLTAESGSRYGFELVFFKRRTDLDKFAVVPLRLIGNPYFFAHFALTDINSVTFRYAHRKSANRQFDLPASASETHYYLNVGDWSVRESNGIHILRATIDDSTTFEAALSPLKTAVLNGENGVSYKDEGQASRYFSYTRMAADAVLVENGTTLHLNGFAWMDREFGTWTPTENQKGWDWFSIQLDNGCELMCYQLRNSKDEASRFSRGTFVDELGNTIHLEHSDLSIAPIGAWKSPRSGAEYPSGWKIEVPKLALRLDIAPVVLDQELDTRGTTMIIYWEGACNVAGSAGTCRVTGQAYVELVGYDRSHERPNLAYFLVGNPYDLLAKVGL